MGCIQDPTRRQAGGRATLWLVGEDAVEAPGKRLLGEYDVQVLADGPSVLGRLSLGTSPDVVVLSERLAPKLGAEICRRLREEHDPLTLPILALLSSPAKQAIVEMLEAGANDCLPIPCDPAELRARLENLARLGRMWLTLDTERDRLRLATEASGVATWDFYPQTGELFWDGRVKELLGVSPGVSGDYSLFLAAVHPEERAMANEAVERAIDPGGTGEYRIQCRMIGVDDRIERWIATQGRAFFAGGKAVRFIGTCLDITEQKRAERSLDLLAIAGAILAETTEYETRVEAAVGLCVEGLADVAVVDLLDASDELRLAAVAHADPSKEERIRELRRLGPPDPESHPAFRVLRSGAPIFAPQIDPDGLHEVSTDPGQLRMLDELSIGSLLVVPLFARQHRLGALTLGRQRSRMPFDRTDLRVAEELARLAATAFDNALLLRQAESSRNWMMRLQAVTAGLSSARTLEQVAEVTVAEGCAAFGARAGALYRLAEGGGELALVRTMGYPETIEAAWQLVPMSLDLPMTSTARTAAPIFCETAEDLAARYPGAASILPDGAGSMATAALSIGGVVLGAVCFTFARARTFSDDDRTLLGAIAHQAAQAFERARLHDAEARAREAAEAANRIRDEFLSIVSHELRTPLTPILGWTRMLSSGKMAADRQARAVATIERNARAQAHLVEDLLDFSSIIVGKLKLTMGRVEMIQPVEAAVDTLRPAAESKGLSLDLHLDPLAGAIRGDALRVQQIAWNLLSNAVKFTPGGGRVTITLRRDAAWIELTVADTGEGIAPDFLSSVFERFRQADSSVTRAHGGLGLGLAIVKHLVEEHSGRIEARSEGVGKGATFTAWFPVSGE